MATRRIYGKSGVRKQASKVDRDLARDIAKWIRKHSNYDIYDLELIAIHTVMFQAGVHRRQQSAKTRKLR